MFSLRYFQDMPERRFWWFVAMLRFAAAIGFIFAVITATANPTRTELMNAARPHWNPAHFLINAFVVPAFEQDEMPLRWFDPRAKLHCGPDTTVRVNGKPMMVGTAVPAQPFEIAWHAHDCRPFGTDGPRVNGRVTLTVYREDWGLSASYVPAGLRFTWPDGEVVDVLPGASTMPNFPSLEDPD